MSVPCGAGVRTLRQLHKLAPKDVVQAQLSGDFLRDVQTVSSSSIDIDFLKNENIGIRIPQEIYDRPELQATVNVPIDHSYRAARPGEPLNRPEILGDLPITEDGVQRVLAFRSFHVDLLMYYQDYLISISGRP